MLRDFMRLTRFEHALMLALAVLIAEAIVLRGLPPLELAIALSLLVPIFSEMGAFALNDYFDIETDRLNKRDRPLVTGAIKPGTAFAFSIAALVISTGLAFLINWMAFLIALVFNLVAVLYNWRLKDTPLLGNGYIALTMAIPFIFGNFVVSSAISETALALAALGFVAGLAREIIKSVQDMEGDVEARGSRTLPVIIGRGPATWLAVLLYLLFLPLTALPFVLGLPAGILPLAMIIVADALILAVCHKSIQGDYRFARNASLAAFFIGMVGILAAAL